MQCIKWVIFRKYQNLFSSHSWPSLLLSGLFPLREEKNIIVGMANIQLEMMLKTSFVWDLGNVRLFANSGSLFLSLLADIIFFVPSAVFYYYHSPCASCWCWIWMGNRQVMGSKYLPEFSQYSLTLNDQTRWLSIYNYIKYSLHFLY